MLFMTKSKERITKTKPAQNSVGGRTGWNKRTLRRCADLVKKPAPYPSLLMRMAINSHLRG